MDRHWMCNLQTGDKDIQRRRGWDKDRYWMCNLQTGDKDIQRRRGWDKDRYWMCNLQVQVQVYISSSYIFLYYIQ